MKKIIIVLSTFSVHFLLTACLFGSGISGKYVFPIPQKPQEYSYSIVMNFMSDGFVEIKFIDMSPSIQGLFQDQEVPYDVKDGRVTVKSQTGDQLFKIQGDTIIASGGSFPGVECPKRQNV